MKKVLASIAIVLLVAVMSLCFVGCTEKADYTVGIIQLVTHDALDAATKGFKDALTEELKKAGKTVKFLDGNAANDPGLCVTLANDYVSKNVDLIMANATPALQAAANATQKIPILGTSVTEYGVALGLTNFTGTVGGNISGTSDLAPLKDQAKMMVELLPNMKKAGLLYCSSEDNSKYQVDVVKAELEKAGITCVSYSFSDSNDIRGFVEKLASECDACYIPTDNTAASNGEIIDSVLGTKGIPVFAGEEGICKGCGFATLSISYYGIGAKTGKMAAEILLGKANISEMAIAYDESPVKKYHKGRAEKLGLTIPVDYVQVDEAAAE